jgi:hypothetical protein
MAIELLQVLSVQSTRQWHDIVTLEESWVYLSSEYDLMWTALGEIVVDGQRHTIQSPKFTLTVVWNPIGFHILKALRRGAHSMHNIIQIIPWSQSQIEAADRGNTAEQVVGAF